ncbi:MAG: hypothetical protein F7C34_03135 [Desulfurococcales archaeon]|nr:hypothetical protein [Desulfurococcales archaeon]
MVPRAQVINKELVERVRRKVLREYEKLSASLYIEEGDLPVMTALSDSELEHLVLLALREARQPVSWRELKAIFAGIAGEDRLRKILAKLKAENVIAELTKTRYALPEYVPLNEIPKIKNPGIISKIYALQRERQ